MTISVHIWWAEDGTYRWLGAAHAAMTVETTEFGEQYVTWNSRGGGVAMPQLGFEKITHNKIDYKRNINQNYRSNRGYGLPNKHIAFNDIVTLRQEILDCRREPETTFIKEINLDHSRFEYGVDAEMISRWWNTKLKLEPEDPKRVFDIFSTELNCVSIVMEGLLFGGLGCYAPIPKNWKYNSGHDLNRWVLAATSEIARLNDQKHDLLIYPEILQKALRFALFSNEDLTKFEDWKSNSNKNIYNPLAGRYQQVANIDQLIKEYHAIAPNTHEMDRESILLRIYNNAITHLTQKPNSDRRDAVLDIAIKALGGFLRKRKDRNSLCNMDRLAAEMRNSVGSETGFRKSYTSTQSWGCG